MPDRELPEHIRRQLSAGLDGGAPLVAPLPSHARFATLRGPMPAPRWRLRGLTVAVAAAGIVIVALAGPFTHVLGPSTTFGKDVMPRIAALLDTAQVSDIMAVESPTRFRRPIYAGNAILTVEVAAGSKIVGTVRIASFEGAPGGGSARIEKASLSAELPTHTRFISVSAAKSDRPDLQTAARVVSGGRALGSADAFKILYSLADRLGAAVGASRAAVDAGFAPNELQVGQDLGDLVAVFVVMLPGVDGKPATVWAYGRDPATEELTGISSVDDAFLLLYFVDGRVAGWATRT